MSERLTPEMRDVREAWELLRDQIAATGDRERPNPTPSEGPDPYGNPDPDPAWLGVDWREHLRSVDAGGTRVNYVDYGPTEPGERGCDLVLVHGLAGCWQNWLETVPHFGRRHRVLALDLPGCGHSPMPPWEISVAGYGKLIAGFCDAVEVGRPAAIVGNSLGGFIAAEAVIDDQARFERMVLVAAAGVSSASVRPEPAELAGRLVVALGPLALSFQESAIRRPRLRDAAFRAVFRFPSKLRRVLLYEQYTHGSGRPAFLPTVASVSGYDFLDRLEEVETPTLIVWGRDDLVIPVGDAAGYSGRLRNSQTVIMADTGHCPMLERPVRFNRLVDAFLANAA
jgi:pimeloyl-ACP methyl ester carboxylesterase